MKKKKIVLWKYFPVVLLLSFMSYILSLVGMTIGKTPEYVEKDYYAKDIRSNEILAEFANANQLKEQADFHVDYKSGEMNFDSAGTQVESGSLIFSRPSNSKDDKVIDLQVSQKLNMKDFAPGKWKVEALWSDGEKRYRMRKDFFVE